MSHAPLWFSFFTLPWAMPLPACTSSSVRLGYPNHEVRRSLNGSLLRAMVPDVSVEAEGIRLRRLLRS